MKKFFSGVAGFFSVLLKCFLFMCMVGMIVSLVIGTALAVYIRKYVDREVDESLFFSVVGEAATDIYYFKTGEDGKEIPVLLENEELYGEYRSIFASYEEFPQDLIDAFIAIEDKRFESHNGVDWLRTVSAISAR